MKLLGIAFFLLAALCVCTVGEDIPTTIVNAATSAVTSKAVTELVNTTPLQTTASQTAASLTTASQKTTLEVSVQTTAAIRATNEIITSSPTSASPGAPTQAMQGTTTQPPEVTSAANKSFSSTNTAQASGTQLTQNETLGASSTMGSSFSSTVSPERSTSASGTSGLPVSSATNLTNRASGNPKSSSGDKTQPGSDIRYSNVILPIVITLIVITLSVFSLVALYKMCQKKTPERQENGAEQAQSDKEGVKLLSVKTTSPETVFVEVCDRYEIGFSLPSANLSEPTAPPPSGDVSHGRTTGEHSSHGKNKTRQLFTSQQ